MAIYYFNGAAILAPFTIISNEPVFDMTTVSLKTQRASQGHQRWELTFSVQPEGNLTVDTMLSQLGALDTSHLMIMPQFPQSIANLTVSGSTLVASVSAAGTSTIEINGQSVTGTIPRGSFVKLAAQDKIYIVTNNVTFNGTDNQDIPIYPPLRAATIVNSPFYTGSGAQLSYFQSVDNATGITYTDGVLANPGTITLIEAL